MTVSLNRKVVDPKDESDIWTENDMRDISMASLSYALQSVWGDAENGSSLRPEQDWSAVKQCLGEALEKN